MRSETKHFLANVLLQVILFGFMFCVPSRVNSVDWLSVVLPFTFILVVVRLILHLEDIA